MSGSLVFITGSTGFIGAEVLQQTLDAGYRVRLSIRKPEQADIIKKRYANSASQIETVIIPDISKREPFSEALEDVEHIIHLASPVPGKGSDLREDYVKPAVQGTEAILYAALNFPKIKSVVVTSSVLALLPLDVPMQAEGVIKENTGEVLQVDLDMDLPDGPDGHGMMYRISKILAHQATRDFLEREKPVFKLVTTHPVFVIGHSRIQNSAEQIDFVNGMLMATIQSEKPSLPSLWVDVKDVATAHVRAISSSAPTGTEFILSCPYVSWEDIVTLLKEEYPDLTKLQPPFGIPVTVCETGSAETYLDLKWTPWEQTFKKTIDQQLSFKSIDSQ